MPNSFYISIQCFQVTIPIFTYGIKIIASFTPHRIEELCDELIFHMFNGIQTHSVEIQFIGNPLSPTVQFRYNFRMVQVNIVT